MTDRHAEKPSSLRRIWRVLVSEFTLPPKPRRTPSEKEFAEGHHAVGKITAAIEDGHGGDVQGADKLVIRTDIPGYGALYRNEWCPLSTPGSGRQLIGHTIEFRHTTYDPDYSNDILVTWWPLKARETFEPVRYKGPGALRARIWSLLCGTSFVIGYAGVMLTPILLCDVVVGAFGGPRVLAEFLPEVHPAIALAVSVGVIPVGMFVGCFCATRRDALLAGKNRMEDDDKRRF